MFVVLWTVARRYSNTLAVSLRGIEVISWSLEMYELIFTPVFLRSDVKPRTKPFAFSKRCYQVRLTKDCMRLSRHKTFSSVPNI